MFVNINKSGDGFEEWFGISESLNKDACEQIIEDFFSRKITTGEIIHEFASLANTTQESGYYMYIAGGVVMLANNRRFLPKEDFHKMIKSKLPIN